MTEYHLSADECEIRTAVADTNITLGSHSWNHPNMTAVDRECLERELAAPQEWLQRRFPDHSIPWFSYPFGLENPEVREAARMAGYDAAVRVAGGWFTPPGEDPMALPRLNIPAGISRKGFLLRLSGLVSS